ncbi:hypothetical protein BN12_30016 [Nostocoides japonicum T1-X7]|uniref:Uncharacterized protein n=1 Tax=Nostocoides japonicum T1-X7 TaxID=1194083 RepID=A0A077M2P7_9MICO|nr:hypothetical protein [Tetrasphaera japonica]CCH78490.1 hypothetical protein BN12_30016 [Tetrasphaera japonica T1-X7]
MAEQPDWRFCVKCQVLFYDGYNDKGHCPADDGEHARAGYHFVLPHDVPEAPTSQAAWRFCDKCFVLFFDGYEDKKTCPVGDRQHRAAGFQFVLPHDVNGEWDSQTEWRFCIKCQALFYNGYPNPGRCAGGDLHQAAGFHFVLPYYAAQPGPIADRWQQYGGLTGPLGAAVGRAGPNGAAYQFTAAPGLYQGFENGAVAWTPNQGRNMTVAIYEQAGRAVLDWGTTDPWNYDRFIVRWSLTTSDQPLPLDRWSQADVSTGIFHPRTWGSFTLPSPPGGIGSSEGWCYYAIVEGYDNDGDSDQGWTYPVRHRIR